MATQIDRRTFLGSSTIALAGAALGGDPQDPDEQLPPSLAALESMADQARPITSEERQGRIEMAQRLMSDQGMDAMMLTGGTSLVYLTNVKWGVSERLFGLFLPRRGRPFVVCPAFEEERAMEQLAEGPLGTDADVITWEEHESPYEKAAGGLRDRGIASGRLGIEETVRYVFSDGLADAAPALGLASATQGVSDLRHLDRCD